MRPLEFWEEVRRRRNRYFLVGVGWLAAGPILFWLYSLVLPGKSRTLASILALGTWGIFWSYVSRRLTSMNCYACGKKAFAHPLFFMRHARCASCGTRPADAEAAVFSPDTLERTPER